MIKRNGKNLTPEQMAAKIVEDNLGLLDYWGITNAEAAEGMTEDEKLAVYQQIQKYADDIRKMTYLVTKDI